MESLKWIIGYLKYHIPKYSIALILVLITSLLSMINPFLAGDIVDRVLNGNEKNILIPILIIMLVVVVIKGILTYTYQMIFERAVGTLEPNKYYIGDKDGYIAIYKSDVNGIPVIENEDDITQREVSLLMEIDQNMIRNYEMVFDTKEECEEALSNFIS